MYYGEAHTSLDDKGRLAVPVLFRRIMEVMDHDTWIITRGFDNALFMYHKKHWEKLVAKEQKRQPVTADVIDFRRIFFGSAAKAKLDRQGRLPVAPHLREYADVDREGVLLGVDDHLELWSKTNWRAFQESRLPDYKNMVAEFITTDYEEPTQQKEDTSNVDT